MNEPEVKLQPMECMGRYRHIWVWIWENGEFSNRIRCTTCGEVKENKSEIEKVIRDVNAK